MKSHKKSTVGVTLSNAMCVQDKVCEIQYPKLKFKSRYMFCMYYNGSARDGALKQRLIIMTLQFIILCFLESGSCLEISRIQPQGSVTLTTWHPLSANLGTNFADKWRSLEGLRPRS
jgi:hypothetical protein